MHSLSGFGAVVFDLDDTLFDHRHAASTGCRQWCEEVGFTAGDREAEVARWLTLESEFFERYRAGHCTFQEQRLLRVRSFLPDAAGWNDEQAGAAFARYLVHYRNSWRAFSDVRPVLAALRDEGHTLAVLTNGDYQQQAEKLSGIGVSALIDALFASSRLPAAKPARESFLYVSAELGTHPSECLMIGDNHRVDVMAAREAGWSAVWLCRRDAGEASAAGGISSLWELLNSRPHQLHP